MRSTLDEAIDAAPNFAVWRALAEEHDALSGADAWRDDDESPWFDAVHLRGDIAALRGMRLRGDGAVLVGALTTSVYRHQTDLACAELYDTAMAGTKRIVGQWLDEVEAGLRWLAAHPIAGISAPEKRRRFEQASTVYGRSALLLSGGATWGFHHLGVVKALFENDALPDILSGASTGAMIAAGVCTRDDAGLAALFADPDQIRLDGLQPVGLRRAWKDGAWLDPARLEAVLRHNCGDLTFAEAYARSGRVLGISVSPTRTRQKPRLLSYVTAPDVCLVSAALASSALPGLFPPVELLQRDATGRVAPYARGELWADGSITGDLPKLRLSRLHNVNHFIVSQTNPHVSPWLGLRAGHGVAPAVAGAAALTVRMQGAYAADLARRAAPKVSGTLGRLSDRAHALVTQDYRGDIDIHPRFRPALLTRMVTNPSRADLAIFIREGERATYPRLPRILDETRLRRVFRACVESLGPEAGPAARALA